MVDSPRSISSGTWLTTTANAENVPSAIAATSSTNGRLRAIAAGVAVDVRGPLGGVGVGPGAAQPEQVRRDRDDGEHDGQHEVGAAPAERPEQRGGQRGEDVLASPASRVTRGQRGHPPRPPPAGQRGERGLVEHAGHRHPGQHPGGEEPRQRRRRARSRPPRAPRAPTRRSSPAAVRAGRASARPGSRPARRPPGRAENAAVIVPIDQPVSAAIAGGQHGEGVVEHPPADDLGARTARRAPGAARRATAHRAPSRQPSSAQVGPAPAPVRVTPAACRRARRDTGPAGTAAAAAGRLRSASNRPAPPQTPVSGRTSSTRSAASWSPAMRGGDGADLLVAGQREERRGAAVALHPDQVHARLGLGQLARRRAGRRCRTSARSGRSAAPARAGPAAPGRGRAGPRTGRTGRAGTRSARRPRRPGRAGAPSTTPAPAARRRSRSTAAVRNPVTVLMCPASTAACGARSPSAPRAGQLVGVAAAEGGADLRRGAAASRTCVPGSLLGELGERDQRGERGVAAAGDGDALAGVAGPHGRVGRGRAPGRRSGRRRRVSPSAGRPSPPSGLGARPGAGGVDDGAGGDPLLAAGGPHVHGQRLARRGRRRRRGRGRGGPRRRPGRR